MDAHLVTQPDIRGEPLWDVTRTGSVAEIHAGMALPMNWLRNSAEVNNLHSGPDYYRDRIWDAEVEETALRNYHYLWLACPDGDQGYPGNADITVSLYPDTR